MLGALQKRPNQQSMELKKPGKSRAKKAAILGSKIGEHLVNLGNILKKKIYLILVHFRICCNLCTSNTTFRCNVIKLTDKYEHNFKIKISRGKNTRKCVQKYKFCYIM